jgi:hypothetical protein
MSIEATVLKDPQASLPFAVDWTKPGRMPEGNTITSSEWEVHPTFELRIDGHSHDGQITTAWISAGEAGTLYRLTNSVSYATQDGIEQSDRLSIAIKVEDR